jgi:cbb3-type cytochrome oxidase maturation protein
MSIVYLLAPLAFLLALGFVTAFLWGAANGQCDDLDTPAHRMLLENESDGETHERHA